MKGFLVHYEYTDGDGKYRVVATIYIRFQSPYAILSREYIFRFILSHLEQNVNRSIYITHLQEI